MQAVLKQLTPFSVRYPYEHTRVLPFLVVGALYFRIFVSRSVPTHLSIFVLGLSKCVPTLIGLFVPV